MQALVVGPPEWSAATSAVGVPPPESRTSGGGSADEGRSASDDAAAVHRIEALGFPVFAAGVVPTPPLRELTGELDAPIRCAGSRFVPAITSAGDSDGVVVVPAELHDEILSRVDGR